MKIKLWHARNVDLADMGGYRQTPAAPKRQTVEVGSLRYASNALREWVRANGLGGGNMDKHAGEVFEGEKLVAIVSYNGRVWTPETDWKARKEIEV